MPPGLYLHVPFCSAICPYCDFSVLKAGAAARARFVEHLVAEVPLAAAAWADPQPFDTIYFGGGTPSQLAPSGLAQIVEACRTHLAIAADASLFLEVNPEDVTAEACAAWRALGVRTLSLGVQAFSDDALRFLGRRHDGGRARAAAETALDAGFRTVSLDLIFGLPGQSPAAWKHELKEAVSLGPGHISCYQLTIHERTRFGVARKRGQLAEMPEVEQAVLFELSHGFLSDAGYSAYEVSNFARTPDHRSRHNQKYWDHTPYLGLGPSAHSFATTPAARRWWNERRVPGWQARIASGERPVESEESLGRKELATEALMLGLRTTAGLDLDAYAASFGFDPAVVNQVLVARLVEEGRLAVHAGGNGRRLAPTVSGLAVADGLAAAFEVPLP
jgi:putative oxygen-independent coproporphyrinogen III oxidase